MTNLYFDTYQGYTQLEILLNINQRTAIGIGLKVQEFLDAPIEEMDIYYQKVTCYMSALIDADVINMSLGEFGGALIEAKQCGRASFLWNWLYANCKV